MRDAAGASDLHAALLQVRERVLAPRAPGHADRPRQHALLCAKQEGRSIATRHQVLTALAARYVGPEPEPVRRLGIGINFAVGDQRRLVLRDQNDTPPNLPPAVVREIETGGRALLEYMMACGPEPGDLPACGLTGTVPRPSCRSSKTA